MIYKLSYTERLYLEIENKRQSAQELKENYIWLVLNYMIDIKIESGKRLAPVLDGK